MGSEPLVALDLADTLMAASDPQTDLLSSPERSAAWWGLELWRLPESPVPDLAATRRLRAAIRDLLDAHLENRRPRPISIEDVNAAAAAVPTSPRLVCDEAGEHQAQTRWHRGARWQRGARRHSPGDDRTALVTGTAEQAEAVR